MQPNKALKLFEEMWQKDLEPDVIMCSAAICYGGQGLLPDVITHVV